MKLVRKRGWTRMGAKRWSSEHADVTEDYITPTDVKQFVFCPRVTYFTRVARLKPIMGSQQEAGQKSHDYLTSLEKRRQSILKASLPFESKSKEFDVYLLSEKLRVRGRLDMLLTTTENERIPIEFKDMFSNKGRILLDHKYQLIVLALLLEETRNVIIRRGVVYYLRDKKTVVISISTGLRNWAKGYIRKITKMIEHGQLPEPRPQCRFKRVGCGFADQCADY
jgi:CRISPR-associated exonuclease Cas4